MIAIETVAETETVIETVTVTAEGPTVAAATAIAIVTATVAAVALDVITDRVFFFFVFGYVIFSLHINTHHFEKTTTRLVTFYLS